MAPVSASTTTTSPSAPGLATVQERKGHTVATTTADYPWNSKTCASHDDDDDGDVAGDNSDVDYNNNARDAGDGDDEDDEDDDQAAERVVEDKLDDDEEDIADDDIEGSSTSKAATTLEPHPVTRTTTRESGIWHRPHINKPRAHDYGRCGPSATYNDADGKQSLHDTIQQQPSARITRYLPGPRAVGLSRQLESSPLYSAFPHNAGPRDAPC